jgi:hypothetical protein
MMKCVNERELLGSAAKEEEHIEQTLEIACASVDGKTDVQR